MRSRGYIRSTSLFVVAFLCLNPAAVFCLAYCTSHTTANAASTHCPHKKQKADCHGSKKPAAPQDTAAIDTDSAKGCVMPVNILAAPVESKFGVTVDIAVVAEIEKVVFVPVILERGRSIPKFYYRPPPNDTRFERVRNQIFRI